MDLPDFLLARIAEDSAVAQALAGRRWYAYDDGAVVEWNGETWADGGDYLPNRHQGSALLYDPARVLAECAAKRAIVELHTGHHECVAWNRHSGSLARPANAERTATVLVEDGFVHENDPTLRLLALPYADHPDFSPAWRV